MWAVLRRRWWIGILAPAIAAIFATLWWIHGLERSVWAALGPQEDFYWMAVQYQAALGRVREVVRAAATGEPVDADEAELRADVLRSRTALLSDPSEFTAYYQQVMGFEAARDQVVSFQESVLPRLQAALAQRSQAAALLNDVDDHDRIASRLLNEVRTEEIRLREASLRAYSRRRTLGLVIVGADVSVLVAMLLSILRVERERRLKQDREIALAAEQAAVKAKNLFLGMVSHELRSPLQGIVSGLDLLEAEAGASRLIQGIRRDAEALNAQLADLLTLAKGEAGRLEVHPQAFEACDLVADLAERFAEQARTKGLLFTVTVPEEPVFVVADHARIGQCLTNLISNAIKYTGQGRVEVRLFPYDETTRSLRFEVRDTGPGLPAGFNMQDTEPFRRLAPEDSQGQAGAGIGLVIVRLIVSHLGGSITVSTPPGGGTVFRIDIPAEPSGTGEPQPTPGDVVQMLVVDDRPEVLEALAAVARHSGYPCEKASNAAVAANMLAAKRYDVVLIDLDMPIKRGEDLALETRRGGGCNNRTPLIAISAAGDRMLGDARMAPFQAYLCKPIGQRALKEAVGRVLRQVRSTA